MISTTNLSLLPDAETLRRACKAMAALDAILCQDWEYRYFSYSSNWSEEEEFFEMRNGEGGQLLILFRKEGAVINGFSADAPLADKTRATTGLPEAFHEFIFGEPVNSAGTTFCVWQLHGASWQTGIAETSDNQSEEFLSALDGKPETYAAWANIYFAGNYKGEAISTTIVSAIFAQKTLSREMVLSLVNDLEDWDLLAEDMADISYPYHKSS